MPSSVKEVVSKQAHLMWGSAGSSLAKTALYFNGNQGTDQENVAGLSDVPLLRLQAHLQRAYRNPVQLSRIPHRYRSARRVVATSVQVELALVFPRCSWSAALRSRMRPFETGKRALPRSWPINCAPSDEIKEARSWYVDETDANVKGTWCSLSRASIAMGTWLTRW
jgi:hypothetical protein